MIAVSCILINYNTSHYTIPCVASIIENTSSGFSFEIIVVDNASSIEDYTALKKGLSTFDENIVRLTRSKINVGFGAGNMLGVQLAQPCTYYAFINNDTLFTSKNTLQQLYDFMQATPDAGICSPQMLDEDGKFRVTIDHFSSVQREVLRRPLLEKLNPNKYLNRKVTYQQPTAVHYVQGSFMFCDAQDFNTIGGFDTNLFLYYEESDISRRLLKEHHKKTYLIPQVEYIHYKGGSTTRGIAIKMEQKISLIYYIQKHYGWLHAKYLLVHYSFRYFFTSIIKPKYWPLFVLFLTGAPLSRSLKQQQKINEEI